MRRAVSLLAIVALATSGCATQSSSSGHSSASAAVLSGSLPGAHPQAVEPAAGNAAAAESQSQPATSVSVDSGGSQLTQPASDAQIRNELSASGLVASPNQATLTPEGLAIAPINAPAAVQEAISAGNAISHLPYVWGGGHVTYEDTGFDCSGSISFVFAAAHLLNTPLVSGDLASWGRPGSGKWITVFANGGHTFMYIAGLRFDTVALAQTGSRWSNHPATENLAAFAVRHPPGF